VTQKTLLSKDTQGARFAVYPLWPCSGGKPPETPEKTEATDADRAAQAAQNDQGQSHRIRVGQPAGSLPKSPVGGVDARALLGGPALLRQVAGIGNNLNQIARRINASPLTTLDKVEYLAALAAVARELEGLRRDRQNP